MTLRVIRDALAEATSARSDDTNLRYLDNLKLYGAADAETHPLPDALHPDTETHHLIGTRFVDFAFGPEGVLGASTAV